MRFYVYMKNMVNNVHYVQNFDRYYIFRSLIQQDKVMVFNTPFNKILAILWQLNKFESLQQCFNETFIEMPDQCAAFT